MSTLKTHKPMLPTVITITLRDINDEKLSDYGTFLNLDDALQGLRRAVGERIETIQLINGYGNTVTALEPGERD